MDQPDPLDRIREAAYRWQQTQQEHRRLLSNAPRVETRPTMVDPPLPHWLLQREVELSELKQEVERQLQELAVRTKARVALVVPWLDEELLKGHLRRIERERLTLKETYNIEYALAKTGKRPDNWEQSLREHSNRFVQNCDQEIKEWDRRWEPFPWEGDLPRLLDTEPEHLRLDIQDDLEEELDEELKKVDPESASELEEDDILEIESDIEELQPELEDMDPDIDGFDPQMEELGADPKSAELPSQTLNHSSSFSEIPFDPNDDGEESVSDAFDEEAAQEYEEDLNLEYEDDHDERQHDKNLFDPQMATIMTGTEFERRMGTRMDQIDGIERDQENFYPQVVDLDEDDDDEVMDIMSDHDYNGEEYSDYENDDMEVEYMSAGDDGKDDDDQTSHHNDYLAGDDESAMAQAALDALVELQSHPILSHAPGEMVTAMGPGAEAEVIETNIEPEEPGEPEIFELNDIEPTVVETEAELIEPELEVIETVEDTPAAHTALPADSIQSPLSQDQEVGPSSKSPADPMLEPQDTTQPLRVNFGFDITADFDSEPESEKPQMFEEAPAQENANCLDPEVTELEDVPVAVPGEPENEVKNESFMHPFDVSFNIAPDFDGPAEVASPKGLPDASPLKMIETTSSLVRSASKLFGKSALFGGKAPVNIPHSTPAPARSDPKTISLSAKRVFGQSALFGGKAPIKQPVFDSITKARFKRDENFDARFVHPVIVNGDEKQYGEFCDSQPKNSEAAGPANLDSKTKSNRKATHKESESAKAELDQAWEPVPDELELGTSPKKGKKAKKVYDNAQEKTPLVARETLPEPVTEAGPAVVAAPRKRSTSSNSKTYRAKKTTRKVQNIEPTRDPADFVTAVADADAPAKAPTEEEELLIPPQPVRTSSRKRSASPQKKRQTLDTDQELVAPQALRRSPRKRSVSPYRNGYSGTLTNEASGPTTRSSSRITSGPRSKSTKEEPPLENIPTLQPEATRSSESESEAQLQVKRSRPKPASSKPTEPPAKRAKKTSQRKPSEPRRSSRLHKK